MVTFATFFRHPQTRDNKRGIITGQMDVPITRQGWRKARETANNAVRKPDAIISGPQQRQIIFAGMLASRFGMEFQIDDRLLEMHCGILTGMQESNAQIMYPEYFFHNDGKITAYMKSSPSGENWLKLKARLERFLLDKKSEFPGKYLEIVGSLGPIAAVRSIIHGIEAPGAFLPHIKNLEAIEFDL